MKSLRPVIIISSVISLVGIAAAVYFVLSDNARINGETFSEATENGGLLAVIVVPIILVVTAVVIFTSFRSIWPAKIKNGVTAPARVLEVHDTGVSINDNPQVRLVVEVLPKNGSSFQAEVKTLVSRLYVSLVQPGISAEVVYDPLKPTHVQVSNLELNSIHAGDAESRLRELDKLYEERLITSEEYRSKREEIIRNL